MRADAFDERLSERGVLLLDGGLATELERRGAALDDALWSARLLLDDPGLVVEVHRAYAEAGADVLTTASYQAHEAGFAALGLSREAAHELVLRSVSLARLASWESAAERAPLVAGSIGSYGASLPGGGEYRGRFGLGKDAYKAFHRPRLEALLAAEPDLLALETLPDVDEAEALVELLEEHGARAWLSFTTEDARHTRGGDPLAVAFSLASSSSVLATGVNCVSPLVVEPALALARACTSKPLVAYPNSGEGWDAARGAWTPASTSVDAATLAPRWRAAGARLIGGCCRTGPEDIRRLRAALEGPPRGEEAGTEAGERATDSRPRSGW